MDAPPPPPPKRGQHEGDSQAGGPSPANTSDEGTDRHAHTFNNHLCAHVLVFPIAAQRIVRSIGDGSFGSCLEVIFYGISWLPSTISYCAKEYKGCSSSKIDQFTVKINLQKVHTTLV